MISFDDYLVDTLYAADADTFFFQLPLFAADDLR